MLPAKETEDYYLLVFSAKDYLAAHKGLDLSLNEYLGERISRREQGMRRVEKVINCLWFPMNRFPQKYKEREEVFLHTVRVLDLFPLKMDLLLGEKMEWFCNMEMENSIRFDRQ